MIAWCLVLFKEHVDGLGLERCIFMENKDWINCNTRTILPPPSQSLFLVHFLLIIFLFVFPHMSYTQLVDLENLVNFYFKKKNSNSEFVFSTNRRMKFWTDHQETESREESETILRTWSVIFLSLPFPCKCGS